MMTDGVSPSRRMRRLGNPWVAGIAALLLAVVLGNLDTPRVFLTGVAQAGGYEQPNGIAELSGQPIHERQRRAAR